MAKNGRGDAARGGANARRRHTPRRPERGRVSGLGIAEEVFEQAVGRRNLFSWNPRVYPIPAGLIVSFRPASRADLQPGARKASLDTKHGPAVVVDGQAPATFADLAPPASRNACECIRELASQRTDRAQHISITGLQVGDTLLP